MRHAFKPAVRKDKLPNYGLQKGNFNLGTFGANLTKQCDHSYSCYSQVLSQA
jgi:hypothetical protein